MRKMEFEKKPKSFFLKVRCSGCGNEQIIFSSASRAVKCLACNQVLAESGPGKVFLKSKVVKSF
jgi:small subunit ribosomal protein S27e